MSNLIPDKIISADKRELKDISIDRELDVTAFECPLPLLKTKLALREMAVGQVLKVIATDRASLRDFPAFSLISGHSLLWSGERDSVCIHVLRKVR